MEFTLLEKSLLKIEPINTAILGYSLYKEAEHITHEDLYRVESNLESQLTEVRQKLNEVIKVLNVLVDKVGE